MLPEFDLVLPHSLQQALEFLQAEPRHVQPLAGGTNLVVDMRSGRCSPAVLININDLPELHEIKLAGDDLKIGGAVTISELQENPVVRKNCPVLIDAANVFANPMVRNRATLGGNLVDASPAADCAPPLLALDAEVELVSLTDNRRVRLEDFFTGVRKTIIHPNEILASIYIPTRPPGSTSAYYKIGLRKADAISVVSVAVVIEIGEGQQCRKARIALGSVAPLPMRARQAEKSLENNLLTPKTIQQAGVIAAGEVSPISDLRASADYRRKMVEVLVCRLLRQIARQPQQQE